MKNLVDAAKMKAHMANCLFTRRLLNGKRDHAFMAFLDEANRALMARPDYVGLAPCRSRFKGYAMANSDFDILVIAGEGKVVTEEELWKQLASVSSAYGIKACMPFCFSRNYFEANFQIPTPASNYVYYHAVWPLLYLLRGRTDAIRRLREMARAKHQEYLSRWPKVALNNLSHSVSDLMYHEWSDGVEVDEMGNCSLTKGVSKSSGATIEKLLKRGFQAKDVVDVIKGHGSLWWARAVKMLGHPCH